MPSQHIVYCNFTSNFPSSLSMNRAQKMSLAPLGCITVLYHDFFSFLSFSIISIISRKWKSGNINYAITLEPWNFRINIDSGQQVKVYANLNGSLCFIKLPLQSWFLSLIIDISINECDNWYKITSGCNIKNVSTHYCRFQPLRCFCCLTRLKKKYILKNKWLALSLGWVQIVRFLQACQIQELHLQCPVVHDLRML